jgi:hypothetical protein
MKTKILNNNIIKTHVGSMGTDRNPPSGTDHFIVHHESSILTLKKIIPEDKNDNIYQR